MAQALHVGPLAQRRLARALDALIALSALAALALWVAGARAPHLVAAIAPAAMAPDGGHAYVFAPPFAPRWPYAVPSHPGSALAPGDAVVLEDGRPIGTLDPSHADIRERGRGLHNVWDGSLWFSPSDDTDPRTNGRDYRFVVHARLGGPAAAGLRWSLWTAIALLALRLAPLVRHVPLRRYGRTLGRIGRVALSGTGRIGRVASTGIGRALALLLCGMRRAANFVPLTFGRTYFLASSTFLVGFAGQMWAHPAPFVTQADSFGYIFPGLVWASGGDTTGTSLRDIGYPALTVLAVRLGSLSTLPRIQLILVAAAIACLLASLYVALSLVARRLRDRVCVPLWSSAIAAAAAAGAFVMLLASHDLFVIDIDTVMAEAPHLFPTALTLLLFLGGWIVGSGRSAVVLLLSASLAAYGSALFKPHTLVVVALCVASLAYKAFDCPRALRSPVVAAYGLAVLAVALGLHRLDAQITPAGADFGPRTLFCNRLDVILPVFDTSTPTRLRIAGAMREVMRDVDGWPLMGYSGDRCAYNADMHEAVKRAAEEEGVSTPRWLETEVLRAILHNPLRYGRDAWNQIVRFFEVPIVDSDTSVISDLSPVDEARYAAYSALINMPREAWTVRAVNWVPSAHPRLAGLAKAGLGRVAESFPWVTLPATAAAALVLTFGGRRRDRRLEAVVLATASFTAAFIGTIVLSHSFDIGRYATDVLPISLLWWFIGAAYLLHGAILAAAIPCRAIAARRPPALAAPSRSTPPPRSGYGPSRGATEQRRAVPDASAGLRAAWIEGRDGRLG